MRDHSELPLVHQQVGPLKVNGSGEDTREFLTRLSIEAQQTFQLTSSLTQRETKSCSTTSWGQSRKGPLSMRPGAWLLLWLLVESGSTWPTSIWWHLCTQATLVTPDYSSSTPVCKEIADNGQRSGDASTKIPCLRESHLTNHQCPVGQKIQMKPSNSTQTKLESMDVHLDGFLVSIEHLNDSNLV